MLHLCGGRGYMRANEIERARARRQGRLGDGAVQRGVAADRGQRWALLGADSVDWWNQHVDERALHNELGKMDDDAKRELVRKLSAELGAAT